MRFYLGVFVATTISLYPQEMLTRSEQRALQTPSYILDRAFDAYFKGEFDQALLHFEKYVEIVGDREVPLRYLGRIYIERNELNKAISYLERASKAEAKPLDSLMLLAELYLKMGKTKQAINCLEKILSYDAFHERALSALGYIYHQNDGRKAAAYYKRLILAVQKGSNNPELFYQAYTFLGNFYYHQGDYQKAIFYYRKVVDLDSQNLRNQLILGELYKVAGNFAKSVEALESLLERQPFYEAALESIVESLFILADKRLNRYLRDIQKTKKAREKLMQAIYYFAQENFSESERLFKEVLSENPNRLSAHIGLARIAEQRGDKKTLKNEAFTAVVLSQKVGAYPVAQIYVVPVFAVMAEESEKMNFVNHFFSPVMENLSPEIEQQALDYAELYATHAETLENLEQTRLAFVYNIHALRYANRLLKWYKETNQHQKLDPMRAKAYQIWINQAWLAQAKELARYEQALRYLDHARELIPTGATALFLKGAILYSMGEKNPDYYRQAEPYLSQAINQAEKNKEENPEQNRVPGNYYFYYAMALEKNGNFPLAEQYFLKAIEAEPYNASFQNYLGYLYSLRNEKLEKAHDLLLRALEDDPENEAYLDSYGWILFRMGKPREALEQLILAANFASARNVTDAVIFYHLAEVYYSLADYSLAHFYYTKTLENIDKSSEKLDEAYIRLRLGELQPYRNGQSKKP
ncbi:MAG: tetratricopeptide repeat protein [Leptospiraceae bacterium]|nr:tetratricopeptide repeat protein [Leptospiraceae bacterium]MDW8306928.1 tetratricopeptide repeat protein [Leptospiraceae bacterium]